ncbi:MAG: DUF1456 family protein [Flavobacteriales bacterium]|nr:DUF1456 family protein [Flavobacteriales bacterium]MCB9197231.1 DUF1456 family protein [Flavobacteriales bacterium]
MDNNTILRQLRYTFDFGDDAMIDLFAKADVAVTRAEISDWLKKDSDPDFKPIRDKELASFLNGFINKRRGKREGEQPKPEKSLNNNLIFKKLKIALNYKDTDIIEVFQLADLNVSKGEINNIFRNPGHAKYVVCKDQFLRNFLTGLQLKHRKDNNLK